MCCIFFKYFRKYEDEYSLVFEHDLLSVISGVQIILFRKFYIEIYGKEEFLEKFKNFDVFYKDNALAVFVLFGVTILINLIFVVISLRYYRKIKKKDIHNYNTLILSGSDEEDIQELEESEIEDDKISDKKNKKDKNKKAKENIF